MSLGKINAMANISDQTKDQRAEFSDTNRDDATSELGANRTSRLLFSAVEVDEDGNIEIDGEQINQRAQETLTGLYEDGVVGPENPDFQGGHLDNQYKYEGATRMLERAPEQSDKPNRLGPNLIPPAIDESGEVSTVPSANSVSSPVTGRGFGVKLESRQDPNNFESLGSYLKRRRGDDGGSISIPKGEFADDEKYDWEA